MKSDRLIRPGQRRHRLSQRPSHAEATFPIEDYVVIPHDAKGRTVSLSFSAPPEFRRAASIIRDSNTLPFQTEGDVMRWCLYFGLRELMGRTKDKEARASWALLLAEVEHSANQSMYATYEDKLRLISKDIATVSKRNPQKALALAERVWKNMDQIDDPDWRKMYREMAKRHLDRLRKEVAAMSNGNGHGSKDEDSD